MRLPTLTPTRRRGVELLDDDAIDPAVRDAALRDLERSNRWFGGARAVTAEFDALRAAAHGETMTLLDVGTGFGDVAALVRRHADKHGVRLAAVGVDNAVPVLIAARRRGRLQHAVAADALALPFADRSVDVVICSQVLHHFVDDDAERLLGELDRVARRLVVVADLRRSWLAAALFVLGALVFRFHPITRHDGVVSVLRGFTPRELADRVRRGTGRDVRVVRRLGWRLTTSWSPAA